MHVFSQGCIPRRSVFRGSIPTPFEPKETVSTFGALWQNAPRIYSKHHHVLCGAAHLQVSSCDLSRGDDKFLWSVLLPSSPRWDVLHGDSTRWLTLNTAPTAYPAPLPLRPLSRLLSAWICAWGFPAPHEGRCTSHCWTSGSFCWLNLHVSRGPSGLTQLMSAAPTRFALCTKIGCTSSKSMCMR